jgi:hypothetical protein
MDGDGGPGHPPFRPNHWHGAIVHFSTSWPPQALRKSAARPLRRVQISTADALRASAVRPKTPRTSNRGRRLFSTLSVSHAMISTGLSPGAKLYKRHLQGDGKFKFVGP